MITPSTSTALLKIAYLVILWLLAATSEAATSENATTIESCLDQISDKPPTEQLPGDTVKTSINLLSWNTMKYAREGALATLARLSTAVDIVFLQETLRDVAISTEILDKTQRVFALGYHTNDFESGVEIRSALPVQDSCTLRFLEPWLRTPKAVAVARIRLNQQSLLAINLHAINFTLGTADYAAQLGALSKLIEAHDGPVLIGGDLNNWSARRDERLRAFADKHNLTRVVFQPDWRSRHLGRPVDGFFVRGLTVTAASAIPTQTSDHHPLRITLRIPQAARSLSPGVSPTPPR